MQIEKWTTLISFVSYINLTGNRQEKSDFQLRWMRRAKCGMKYFPSQSLPTFYHLLGTPMFCLGKSILLMNLPRGC